MTINFVVPIRHPSAVIDPLMQQRLLSDLFASISAQTDRDFRCFIACNATQKLPPLPVNGVRLDVDIPPFERLSTFVEKRELLAQFRLDKGSRLAAVFDHIDHAEYLMFLDDDDFIHRDLVAFLNKQKPGQLWVIDKGYEWVTGSRAAAPLDNFHKACGTSVITPAVFFRYASLENTKPGPLLNDALSELGSHVLIVNHAVDAGHVINCVPFRAAIYRRGHVNSEVSQAHKVQPESRHMSALGVALRRLKRRLVALMSKQPKISVDLLKKDFFGSR